MQGRLKNHPSSEVSKAPMSLPRTAPSITVGDLVYLHTDRNKSRARDRYLVISIDSPFCNIKKFVGNQLRSSSYRVKLFDCFKVPADITVNQDLPRRVTDEDSKVGNPLERFPPPCQPQPQFLLLLSRPDSPKLKSSHFPMNLTQPQKPVK